MKKKRFEEGGDVDYDKDTDPEAQEVDRKSFATGVRMTPESKPAPAKPAPRKSSGEQARTMWANMAKAARITREQAAKHPSPAARAQLLKAADKYDSDAKQLDRGWRHSVQPRGLKKGGSVKSSASRRADGIAQRGKTKGRML